MAKKKEKYVPIQGLMGIGEDYNVYNMKLKEKIIGYLIGFAGSAFAAQIMFGVPVASLILGACIGFAAIPVYKKHLFRKRVKAITMQFRDMLDSLSNSFAAGKNTSMAFSDVYNDMAIAYGEKAIIVKEVGIIVNGLANNYTIEDLLKNMAERCGVGDMASFAETFGVCNRLGGNLKKIVGDSRDIINDKLEIEMEIQTMVSSNKNEINILCVIPLVIVLAMKLMGNDAITANTPSNVVVKFIAVGIFMVAYILGQKITDIKV